MHGYKFLVVIYMCVTLKNVYMRNDFGSYITGERIKDTNTKNKVHG